MKEKNKLIISISSIIILLLILIISILFSMNIHHNDNTHHHNEHSHNFNSQILKQVDEIANKPNNIEKPITRNYSVKKTINLETKELIYEENGNKKLYWTFNETTPGPFLRIREGDNITIKLNNHNTSKFTHSIDLHPVNGPGGGAEKTQVKPGEETNSL